MSADSVALDLYFVRFPPEQPYGDESIWAHIDEQVMSPELRRQLAALGMRAGVVGGGVPLGLERLIRDAASTSAVPSEGPAPSDITREPAIVRRHLQLRAGHRGEVVTSRTYPSLPLLELRGGEVCGQTYEQAQARFELTAYPQGDGRVRLQLLPELHHGQPRSQPVVREGAVMLTTAKPRKVFEAARLETHLAPGQMLVVGAIGGRTGSLGHYFFTDTASEPHCRKLLIVRLTQTQHDELFGPDLVPLSGE